jgi:hypothetical protein
MLVNKALKSPIAVVIDTHNQPSYTYVDLIRKRATQMRIEVTLPTQKGLLSSTSAHKRHLCVGCGAGELQGKYSFPHVSR